ncbi:MAG: ketopantoate reductase family protein [Myxococcota bacterium]
MQDAGHLVLGAGAVGIGLGATLLAAGEPVCFVARADTARALRRDGCVRAGLFGEVAFPPAAFRVVDDARELREAPGAVWIATKSWATEDAARALLACAAVRDAHAPIVLAQNGLGNAERFAAHFPRSRVFNARVITGFRRDTPARVTVTVHADDVLLGSLFGADTAPLEPLAAALRRGGLPARTTPDVASELWGKVLYNCALNPLGAILGVPYGELARRPQTRALMQAVVAEILAVMRAEGPAPRWADADAYMRHLYGTLLPPTEDHESSMLQDVRAGRHTEIDALCGEIAARGARVGLATPVNAALAVLVRALEGR